MTHKVIIDIDDVEAALGVGRHYNVTIKPASGGSSPPRGNIEVVGEYGDVLACLVDGFAMSDEDAEMMLRYSIKDDVQDDERTARTDPSGRMFEGFDKFMDRIVIDERKNIVPRETEKSPQRIRAERNQDRPNNKIRYGRVK
jgi:hypothetical protein